MKTAFPILKESDDTKDLFSRSPRVVFQKPKTLKNLLVKPNFRYLVIEKMKPQDMDVTSVKDPDVKHVNL